MTTAIAWYRSPIGVLQIEGSAEAIHRVAFVDGEVDGCRGTEALPAAVEACLTQLDEYFRGKRFSFSLPLHAAGTPFQTTVWSRLADVPYGSTSTYRQISVSLARDAAVRAVGTAVGQNRWAVIIPCHRIIGSDGKLRGYAWGLWRKEWLLQHETEQVRTKK
ncbi:methylated-DNA--[protein]-cysteine S-methyltransferase [Brevibacillus sp. SYP-B805]|uniref:methylated-DNA--[protein]-cysteine S-methyltransferase n=1 Tax=Brevibacillus sp. SYP-B805 TaxID=1578199 RepID=UPI0013EB4627|nr:methylated-DNA--[protein]-cysteine S-methyltransferase [Brevibacillus sp. SYP-B805]NGQ96781.1 methylated-DNA--[protein]-cysteine S-methyltransferase [Brevibacillus sp. SYP-B805]